MRNGAALGRMLALRLNGNRVVAKDVQVAFRIGLLKKLAAFRRRCNRIKNAGIGDPRLRVVRDKLIAVCSDPDAGITRSFLHKIPQYVFASVFEPFRGRGWSCSSLHAALQLRNRRSVANLNECTVRRFAALPSRLRDGPDAVISIACASLRWRFGVVHGSICPLAGVMICSPPIAPASLIAEVKDREP